MNMEIVIPDIYITFLSNRYEREFDDGILYDYDEIIERYETLEFHIYANDYIPIGNDNGDYELVMKAEKDNVEFGFIDQGAIGSMEPKLCQNFMEWYKSGADFNVGIESFTNERVKVYLKALPEDNKTKVLMEIKKALVPDMSISQLLKLSANIPCVITDKYYKAQVEIIMKKYNLGDWIDYKI